GGLRGLPPPAGPLMRWLLVKDMQILRRSPLLLALLVIYPVVIAVLIGFALSRGPDKPRVAFVNLVPAEQNQLDLGGEDIDLSDSGDTLCERLSPVRIDCEDVTRRSARTRHSTRCATATSWP